MIRNSQISCPICGWQYLPGELYLPKYFLGQPTHVVRDDDGKILAYDGLEQDTVTRYTCDHCNQGFIIDARIEYRMRTEKRNRHKYVTKLTDQSAEETSEQDNDEE